MPAAACFIAAYLVHARRIDNPALDLTLFRLPTFFASVAGGFVFRLGLGALPFLMPLLLQLGFGMTPFQSGMITFATALGAMGMKWATTDILRRFGFRNILIVNSLISAVFLGVCATFTSATPVAVMVTMLFVGGFFRSLQFTASTPSPMPRSSRTASAAPPRWSASRSSSPYRRASRSARSPWN